MGYFYDCQGCGSGPEGGDMSAPVRYFYRIFEVSYSAGVDEWGEALPGGPTRTNLEVFKVIRETPKGVWIDLYGQQKFIRLTANKRYALPTVEEAIESYKARKRRQIRILSSGVKRAEEALAYLDNHGFYSDARSWNADFRKDAA